MALEPDSLPLARQLELSEDWVPRADLPRDPETGDLDLEHPALLGLLLGALFMIAPESTVSLDVLRARDSWATGAHREIVLMPGLDPGGRVGLGGALTRAVLEFSRRGWARRFDEALTHHSALHDYFSAWAAES